MSLYESLGEWSKLSWPLLINHLWQATLFCLFILVVSSLLRRAPAQTRYSLWLIALLKFIVPCATLAALIRGAGVDVNSFFAGGGRQTSAVAISPFLSPVTTPSAVLRAVRVAKPDIGATGAEYAVSIQDQGSLYGWLMLIWMVGCLLLLALWLRKRSLLAATIRSGETLSTGREAEILERVRVWLGIRRKVSLVISSQITEPGVWRVFRPVVVLPRGIPEQLSDAELETVMMHEMAHIERWDNLVGSMQRLVCCLLWFHPLVWLLDRRLLSEREQSCDDTVVRLSGASEVYAAGIRKICRHSIGWEFNGLSSAAGSDLKLRIQRIIGPNIKRHPSLMHRVLPCAVLAVVFVLSAAVGLILGDETTPRSIVRSHDAVDSRFIIGGPTDERRELALVEIHSAGPSQQEATTLIREIRVPDEGPIVVRMPQEPIPPPVIAPGVVAQTSNSAQVQPPPADVRPPASSTLGAMMIPVSAAPMDASEFVGRYEVDPAAAENFILDITLEHGELWLKPSHVGRRRLIRTGETSLADASGEFRLNALQDRNGRIVGLRIDSWNSGIKARKLRLPPPSLSGNRTFRLSGYPNARIVAVAGTFNNWNQSQYLFTRVDGEWVCKINLPPGKYEYKFIVDGNWLLDPRNPETRHDQRGFENSLLVAE